MNVYAITGNHKGNYRFGNLLFFTYIISFLAMVNDIPIEYPRIDEITSLGIPLFTEGKTHYNESLSLTNENISDILENPKINKSIIVNGVHDYMQTPETAKFIKQLITLNNVNVNDNVNNNLFVHVRLGDLLEHKLNQSFIYYDTVIRSISFDKGYISSDTINHKICRTLIKRYNLTVYDSSETETIKFGSSCQHIVLSLGTFSWFIGAFSSGKNVYYPEPIKKWHGDIFIFPEWNQINS
jgi:hypothetical protein